MLIANQIYLNAGYIFIYLTNTNITALSDQPVVDTATATEQAKMLIKSGAISAIKSENKNSGFKRSRMLEIKLKVSCYSLQWCFGLMFSCFLALFCLFICLIVVLYVPQDPEKGPVPAFLPFQRSVSTDEEQPEVY